MVGGFVNGSRETTVHIPSEGNVKGGGFIRRRRALGGGSAKTDGAGGEQAGQGISTWTDSGDDLAPEE